MRELLTQTVASLVTKNPDWARVFEAHGVDYCCGGHLTLQDACAKSGASVEEVLHALSEAKAVGAPGEPDFAGMTMTALIDHILETHHAYLRGELPRLQELAGKVEQVHGQKAPKLEELRKVFSGLKSELEMHMMKEEEVLFPAIRQLENNELPQEQLDFLGAPMAVMEQEHENAGAALEKIRELTNNHTAPPEACNSWKALVEGLKTLEHDLFQHIHKENNILFPAVRGRVGVAA